MTDRYGNTRISKIRKAVNELRRAIQKEGTQDIQAAWDRLEPWLDAPIWKESDYYLETQAIFTEEQIENTTGLTLLAHADRVIQSKDCRMYAKEIRARTPDDATEALERVKREARNEALREAAEAKLAKIISLADGMADAIEDQIDIYDASMDEQIAVKNYRAALRDTGKEGE